MDQGRGGCVGGTLYRTCYTWIVSGFGMKYKRLIDTRLLCLVSYLGPNFGEALIEPLSLSCSCSVSYS